MSLGFKRLSVKVRGYSSLTKLHNSYDLLRNINKFYQTFKLLINNARNMILPTECSHVTCMDIRTRTYTILTVRDFFITELESVYCAVRPESSGTTWV